ncbi:MAG: hypothetical protein NXH82_17210 [Rhodobacteraceae bacterium]|nr:hypothetical protein [Paracoccaceae bacterium]
MVCASIVAALTARDHHVEHKTVCAQDKARVISAQYAVAVRRVEASAAEGATVFDGSMDGWITARQLRQRIEITLMAADDEGHDSLEARMILRAVLLDLARRTDPDHVEYLRPEVSFETPVFLAAFHGSADLRMESPVQAMLAGLDANDAEDPTDALLREGQNPFADANVTSRNRSRFVELALRGRTEALRSLMDRPRRRRSARLHHRIVRSLARLPRTAATRGGMVVSRTFAALSLLVYSGSH